MAEDTLYFEDVAEGDEAPVRSHTLTRTDLVMYAGASGDFNPMHHDEVKAQAAGQPSVFGHGMFSMGLLGIGHHRLCRSRERAPVPGEVRQADVARRGAAHGGGGHHQARRRTATIWSTSTSACATPTVRRRSSGRPRRWSRPVPDRHRSASGMAPAGAPARGFPVCSESGAPNQVSRAEPGQAMLNAGTPDEMPLNSSPLTPASSSGVHIESRCTSPTTWKPPITQMSPP